MPTKGDGQATVEVDETEEDCPGLTPPVVPTETFESGEEVPARYVEVEGGTLTFAVAGSVLHHGDHVHLFPLESDGSGFDEFYSEDEDGLLTLDGTAEETFVDVGWAADWWFPHDIRSEVIQIE